MSILDVIREYREEWKNKKVKSPFSNRMILVGSLPKSMQDKYKPKIVKKTEDEITKEYDDVHKLVFDFYISVPKEYETVDEYMEKFPNMLATLDPADVMKYFDKDNYVIKLKNVPITAVQKYFTLNKENDNYDEAEFKDIDKTDTQKAFDFIKFNDYHIFVIAPSPYKDEIVVINDTPDERTGLVNKSKDDDTGVLETIRKETERLMMERLCSKK